MIDRVIEWNPPGMVQSADGPLRAAYSSVNQRSIKYLRLSQVITGCRTHAWLGILDTDDTDSLQRPCT